MNLDLLLAYLKREPVRVRLYSLAALLLGLAVAHGLLSASDLESWVAIAGVVLGVESARAKVSPADESDEDEIE